MKQPISAMPLVVLTIGHSTRTAEEFIHLLKAHGVERLVDVRTVPASAHMTAIRSCFASLTKSSRFVRNSGVCM